MLFSGNKCSSLTSDLCSHNYSGTTCLMWPYALLSFQVNGLDMQGATHHEAVSALRNAGSWIRLTVLRDRLAPPEVPDPDGAQDERGVTGQQSFKQTGQVAKAASMGRTEGCLSKSIEALVCNGNDTVGNLLKYDRFSQYSMHDFYTLFLLFASQPDQANETSQVLSKLTKVSLQDGKHTMGVSTLFADSRTVSNQKRLRKNSSFHADGSLHALLHDFLLFLPWSPPSFCFDDVTDPTDHPHSSLYLRWRCGALDTEPQHRAAARLWHSRQVCLFWQRFLPSLTLTT